MSSATFHRRPLPPDLADFSSDTGRTWLGEALQQGTAQAFFPLVAHLHTQAEPAWCGLGTLVTVLNALEIDPGRTWKGPWRFFGEELLVCCKSLAVAAAEGLSLDDATGLPRGWLSVSRPVEARQPAWPPGVEELATRLARLGAPLCAVPPRPAPEP